MRRLYLDIDGVLLGCEDKRPYSPRLGEGAEAFVDFIVEHFDCYWLTTHCRGDVQTVLDYLQPHCTDEMLKKLALIHPTTFRTFKTEALEGDFLWLDDQPTAYERLYLEENDLIARLVEINSRKDRHALTKAVIRLKEHLEETKV